MTTDKPQQELPAAEISYANCAEEAERRSQRYRGKDKDLDPFPDIPPALLSSELVVLDFDQHSYAWVITRSRAEWLELRTTAEEVEAQVISLRLSLVDHQSAPFDLGPSYRLYQSVFSGLSLAAAERLNP